MKNQVLMVLFVSVSICFAAANDLIIKQMYNMSKGLPLGEPRGIIFRVKCEKLYYYLCTNLNDVKKCTKMNFSNPEFPRKCKKVAVIIHGWFGSHDADWYPGLSKAFLQKYSESCVLQVDWAEYAMNEYWLGSSVDVDPVGRCIGKFLLHSIKNSSVSIKNLIIAGFSLGAHVAGFAGKEIATETRKKVPIIFGIDPAGPAFNGLEKTKRLSSSDAEKVHVLHTSAGSFGITHSCGTIDFWANGGKSQPFCNPINPSNVTVESLSFACDHVRAPHMAYVALTKFKKCKSRHCTDVEKNKCSENFAYLGDLETDAVGNFYFNTTDKFLFIEEIY